MEQKTEDNKDGGDGEPEKKGEEKEKKSDEEGGGGDSDEGGGVGGSSAIAAGGDTALYLTASQLLRQRDFLLPDIRSLMVRGEVEGLFTIEEKHELNEARILQTLMADKTCCIKDVFFQHVHQHLLSASQRGIISELTPSALYELFVSICKRRLHLIIGYDGDNPAELQILRENDCLTKNSFHLIVQVRHCHLWTSKVLLLFSFACGLEMACRRFEEVGGPYPGGDQPGQERQEEPHRRRDHPVRGGEVIAHKKIFRRLAAL